MIALDRESQLKKFWNSAEIQKIKSICDKYKIKIYYLVLVGYDKSLKTLEEENKLTGIEIMVCDILSDKNRVFSDENIIWDKKSNERQKAINYFEKIRKTKR